MSDTVSVEIPQGSLNGRVLDEGGVLFAGIPFAQPPTGALRLRPPQPPRPWAGVRDASDFLPPPPQNAGLSLPPDTVCSEDSLHVNVWTPDVHGRRPVMVWIYGGAYETGSAAPPVTDGQQLMRGGDVVVVSFNYRIGALGFVHLAGIGGQEWADTANLGLQDQVAVLRWIRENIAEFGGDPDNVTVFGNSAGAGAIGCLLAMPTARGLFQRAVMMSPPIGRIYSPATAEQLATQLLDEVGIHRPEQLANVPVEHILTAQSRAVSGDLGARALPGGRSWGPVLDGIVLPGMPLQAVEAGETADVSLLVGANRDEMLLFERFEQPDITPPTADAVLADMAATVGQAAARDLWEAYQVAEPDGTPARLRLRFLSDYIYRIPASRMADAHIRAGGTAHQYLFAADLPGLGAGHGTEVALVFGGHKDPANPLAQVYARWPGSDQLSREMMAAWTAFAHSGDPGWTRHAPGATDVHVFGADGPVAEPPVTTREPWHLATYRRTVAETPAGHRPADGLAQTDV
ncbi:carboxylesterase/lipase family protein [Catenulispora rubra]|uniref:carboxylesterase/lipase family protein n=1 Tax=Catenulispora rubra TaxID=280293 RepID=UPI001892752A|nr:carboxylesterase family protein [Catenulispora rubra]